MNIDNYVELEKKIYQIRLFLDETEEFCLSGNDDGHVIIRLHDQTTDTIDSVEKLRHYCTHTLNWFYRMYDTLNPVMTQNKTTLNFWNYLIKFIRKTYVRFETVDDAIWMEQSTLDMPKIKKTKTNGKGRIFTVKYNKTSSN